MCEICNDEGFDFHQSFPMYVMKMETFMQMKKMCSFEDMLAEGLVFEWEPWMGRVWFMSHQWTSFSHPDPGSEQLDVAQQLMKTVMAGKMRDIFATEEEWQAYITKEANRFLNFPELTAEGVAEDAKHGYVWLDYSSVPQAREAEEQRANAIDSIPYYVDHALVFLALVPRVEHKDLPGVFCDYKSWTSRGWCRLETQVHELRLSHAIAGEMMPGIGRIDVPRRPLIVHSGDYATTYDMMDNFYMMWQRQASVFTGEFACCRLGHKGGHGAPITCDKDRIRPLVRGLWDRKVAHLKTQNPLIQFMLLWRWASHVELMMAETPADDGHTDDPNLHTLDDVLAKYECGTSEEPAAGYFGVLNMFFPMMKQMFGAHPSFAPEAPRAKWPGKQDEFTNTEFQAAFLEWTAKWEAMDAKTQALAVALMFMVAEGNLPMVQKLHTEYGADLSWGYMWGITLLDFAAGKRHLRVMKYLLDHGEKNFVNKPSFRERITAVDRACKAGFVDGLNLLHEHGASLVCRRLNGQTPAHGAAMMGHIEVLKRLHELGADVLTPVDDQSMAPLDYALYYRQMPSVEFLRSLGGGENYMSLKETAAAEMAAAKLLKLAKIQALAKGGVARKQLMVIKKTGFDKKHKSETDGMGYVGQGMAELAAASEAADAYPVPHSSPKKA